MMRRRRFRPNQDFGRNGANGHSRSVIRTDVNERKYSFRNNQNAPRLLEKYTSLGKEALSSGDRILSENYFQHAEHFLRLIAIRNSTQTTKKDNNVSKSINDESGLKEKEKEKSDNDKSVKVDTVKKDNNVSKPINDESGLKEKSDNDNSAKVDTVF